MLKKLAIVIIVLSIVAILSSLFCSCSMLPKLQEDTPLYNEVYSIVKEAYDTDQSIYCNWLNIDKGRVSMICKSRSWVGEWTVYSNVGTYDLPKDSKVYEMLERMNKRGQYIMDSLVTYKQTL